MGVTVTYPKLFQPMGPAGAAAVSAGGNIVSNLINKIGAKRRAKRAVEQQKELADYQYAKDLEQWNRENEYNSPEQTMARLKNAGLNPHLAYGTGTQGNTSASSPDYDAGQVQREENVPVDLGINSALATYQNAKMTNAQIDQVREVTKGQAIKNSYNEIEREILGYEARKKGIEVEGLETYQNEYLKSRNESAKHRAAMALLEKEWRQTPEYKKNRQKWEAKRGRADNAAEFFDQLFEEDPELQEKLKSIVLDGAGNLKSVLNYLFD